MYSRSDHVGIDWQDAKRDLEHRSAYGALPSEIREGLFDEHMMLCVRVGLVGSGATRRLNHCSLFVAHSIAEAVSCEAV